MAITKIINTDTPAGSNTEVQYNDNGVFGSSSNLTFSGSVLAVTGASTISTSLTVGGGYGSTGATISTAGVGQFNGALTTDGALTAASASFSDGNITNVADIAVDTITGDADADSTIGFGGSGSTLEDQITFNPGGVEAIRIGDTVTNGGGEVNQTGRVLMGSTLSVDVEAQASRLQVLGGNTADGAITVGMFSNDAEGAKLKFIKSRNTTIGSNTIIQNGDQLGSIQFHAADGGDFVSRGASIMAVVNGTIPSGSPNDVPTDLLFGTCADDSGGDVERMRITSAGDVGIGIAAPVAVAGRVIDIRGASTTRGEVAIGTTSSVTNNAMGNISFYSGSTEGVRIETGTSGGNNDNGSMTISTKPSGGSLTGRFTIDSIGRIGFNTGTVPTAFNSKGMVIEQGVADDASIAFKSTDVAHARISEAETGTYGSIGKRNADNGGLLIRSLMEDAVNNINLQFQVHGGQASTGKTTGDAALIDFYAAEHNGANAATAITANGNVFTIRCKTAGGDTTRFLVDEDGDMYSVTTGQTFDAHDDLALVNNYDAIRSDMAGWNAEHESELVRLGVLGDTIANGGMTNVTQLQRLHNGAIRQLGKRNDSLQLELDEMKQQLFLLQEKN